MSSTEVEPKADDATSTDVEVADGAATDDARRQVLDELTAELGEGVIESFIRPNDDIWVRVTRDAWRETGIVVRDRLGFRSFEFLSAIDWLPSPFGKNEDSPTDPWRVPDTEIVTGYAGGDTRFQVFARVLSMPRKFGLTLKVDLPDDDLRLDTWLTAYAGVNWHEREVHEMFGITFSGHPHLVPLYLPGEFEGHPLRKDFPLLARHVKPWPGIVDVEPMPAEDEEADAAEADAAAAPAAEGDDA